MFTLQRVLCPNSWDLILFDTYQEKQNISQFLPLLALSPSRPHGWKQAIMLAHSMWFFLLMESGERVCVHFEALCQCKMLRISVMAHSQAWWAITQMLGCNITAVDGQHWSSSQMDTALGLSSCPHAAPPYGGNPPALLAPEIASL